MKTIQINERFGSLVVLSEVPKEERPNKAGGRFYKCLCDCGNTKIVYGHNLKTGNTKSCGCLSRKTASKNNTKDIPQGSRYGMLTVLGRAEVRAGGLAYWRCLCDCGKEIEVRGTDLRKGHTTSCGCKKLSTLIDETGNKYGFLTVLKYIGSTDGGGALWECKCDCGNIITTRADALRSGHTKSCGCVKSWKEKEITQLLQNYNLSFATQFTFSTLRTIKGGIPRFDFAIFDNDKLYCLIEYHGEQHYDDSSSWYSEEYQERDKIKREYCNLHNIQLLIWNKDNNLEEEVKKIAKHFGRLQE